jgi:TIR domain
MPIITRDTLLEFRSNPTRIAKARTYLKASRGEATATVFLSHSHSDRDLIDAAINFFAAQGVYVYVDWKDPEMPAVTNSTTATRIQDMIRQNRKFVALVTDQSTASRWVPWEVGYADGKKHRNEIAILPVVDRITDKPTEYLGIYDRIEGIGDAGFVYRPGEASPYRTLDSWLRS